MSNSHDFQYPFLPFISCPHEKVSPSLVSLHLLKPRLGKQELCSCSLSALRKKHTNTSCVGWWRFQLFLDFNQNWQSQSKRTHQAITNFHGLWISLFFISFTLMFLWNLCRKVHVHVVDEAGELSGWLNRALTEDREHKWACTGRACAWPVLCSPSSVNMALTSSASISSFPCLGTIL